MARDTSDSNPVNIGSPGSGIIVFDGVCILCERSVGFIINRDPDRIFRFIPFQDSKASDLLDSLGGGLPVNFNHEQPDSFILILNNTVYLKSDAWIVILRHLRGYSVISRLLSAIPRPIRDWGYELIGRNRFRWFGSRTTCLVPTSDIRSRFIMDSDLQ